MQNETKTNQQNENNSSIYVNGEKVTPEQIEQEIERLRPEYARVFPDQKPEERDQTLLEWSRENLIEQVLIRQAAMQCIDISDQQLDAQFNQIVESNGGKAKFYADNEIDDAKEKEIKQDLRLQLQTRQLIEEITKDVPAPTEKEIKKFYDKHIDQFTIPETIHAAHIVKHPAPKVNPEVQRKEMEDIHKQLLEKDNFEEIASQNSDCPDNNGDLGYFPRGKMVPSFEEVVFQLEPGQFSEVFETEFGFHIAKVYDKKPPIPCPIEDVKEMIVRQITDEKKQHKVEEFLDKEREKAQVELKPE